MADTSADGWVLPKEPDGADGWQMPKRPYVPSGGFGSRLSQNYSNAVNDSVDTMRKPGVFNKAMGALGYVWSPVDAVSKTVVGDPVAMLARDMGGGEGVQHGVGTAADLIAQMFGGGAVVKGAKELGSAVSKVDPAAVSAVLEKLKGMGHAVRDLPETVNGAATKVGKGIRSTVGAVEDVAGMRKAGAERRAAEAAANAPPTENKLYEDAGKLFEDAKLKGGELPEGYFAQKVAGTLDQPGLRDALAAKDINVADHPELFKNTSDMLKVLERKAEGNGIQSFGDLIKLHRELRPYVRKAKNAGLTEGYDDDYRAATILRGEVGKLLDEFPDAAGTLSQAKDMWKRASKMGDIEDIMTKADRLNDPDYLRKEFKSLALDDYAMANYTPQERAIIDKIAGTSRLEDLGDALLPGGRASKLKNAVSAARGANDSRMALAKELKDLVARGSAAQDAAAAEKAMRPSTARRILDTLGDTSRQMSTRGGPDQ